MPELPYEAARRRDRRIAESMGRPSSLAWARLAAATAALGAAYGEFQLALDEYRFGELVTMDVTSARLATALAGLRDIAGDWDGALEKLSPEDIARLTIERVEAKGGTGRPASNQEGSPQ